VTFGNSKYTIPSGQTMRVPVKLTGKGKKALRRSRRHVAIVTATSRDARGGRAKERSKITLRR
jgi:hypothetical protein